MAQAPSSTGQTVLVVPFENQSKAPGIEWIGESFPEFLQGRLDLPSLFVLPREDRLRAYDRLGIPAGLHPSRASIYRLAEQLDVDYVLLGSYGFDGRTLTTSAQLLDMHRERLLAPWSESGPLPQLIAIESGVAWDLLEALHLAPSTGREAYIATGSPNRLDAFENYIRGVTAPAQDEQIRHFREAVRLTPDYPAALLQLGKTLYRARQYDAAVAELAKIPQSDSRAREANFYLGLAAYARGDFPRAELAFRSVAAQLPLAEVYNNLGVVTAHGTRKNAVEYFQKAVEADPSDFDYHFNLALELYRNGDVAAASHHLHEALALKPGDSEAKALLDAIASHSSRGVVPASERVPLERIRTNYDESSFRQLALKVGVAAEQRLSKTDPRTHAKFHTDRGHQLLTQGFLGEAEGEFREAVTLNSSSPEAHAGLASVLEAEDRPTEARSEADAALRLRQFPEPLLVLARLDLRNQKPEAAAENVDRALRLEPANESAIALKRTVAAKLAQEAQPLPNR